MQQDVYQKQLCKKQVEIFLFVNRTLLHESQVRRPLTTLWNQERYKTRRWKWNQKRDDILTPYALPQGEREGPGHFYMFGSYESTFYRWTAAFYVTKLSRHVKKLLSFEGQPSDNFPIEMYRRTLVKIWSFWSIFFCFLTLDAEKLVEMVASN